AFFCSLQDRGFRIFPIHRLLKSMPESLRGEPLQQLLSRRHQVEILPEASQADAIRDALRRAGERTFGVVPGSGAPFLVKVAREEKGSDDPAGDLDTVLLERQILSGALGLSAADIAAGALAFTPDAAEACRRARTGEVQAAFLLNPLRTEAVVRAAQA